MLDSLHHRVLTGHLEDNLFRNHRTKAPARVAVCDALQPTS